MIALYVGGHYIGKLPEDAGLMAEYAADGYRVELRDQTGGRIARLIPDRETPVPWDPTITQEELDRRAAEPGLTVDELRKRLGWA